MNTYDTILFDLDGTLTDPKEGITKSVQYALLKFGIIENNLDKLEPFIGPPLLDSFKEFYSLSDNQAVQAISFYRENFSKTGMFQNKPYPGIDSLLKRFSNKKIKLVVATSKPTIFSEKILKHFGLDSYFDIIVGSNLDGSRTSKGEVIEHALSLMDNIKKENVIMVGDRKFDVIGARENGIDCISVTYGYGSMEELTNAHPAFWAKSVEKLELLLDRYTG